MSISYYDIIALSHIPFRPECIAELKFSRTALAAAEEKFPGYDPACVLRALIHFGDCSDLFPKKTKCQKPANGEKS